jgi:hypothetical protein
MMLISMKGGVTMQSRELGSAIDLFRKQVKLEHKVERNNDKLAVAVELLDALALEEYVRLTTEIETAAANAEESALERNLMISTADQEFMQAVNRAGREAKS